MASVRAASCRVVSGSNGESWYARSCQAWVRQSKHWPEQNKHSPSNPNPTPKHHNGTHLRLRRQRRRRARAQCTAPATNADARDGRRGPLAWLKLQLLQLLLLHLGVEVVLLLVRRDLPQEVHGDEPHLRSSGLPRSVYFAKGQLDGVRSARGTKEKKTHAPTWLKRLYLLT